MAAPAAHRARLVLVVDDEPVLRDLMERAFCEAGYGVLSAPDASRALQLVLRAGPPEILVTDLRMDGLTGAELAELITARYPKTRVLMVSGGDPHHRPLRWPLLPKPFSPDQLLAAVDRLPVPPS